MNDLPLNGLYTIALTNDCCHLENRSEVKFKDAGPTGWINLLRTL